MWLLIEEIDGDYAVEVSGNEASGDWEITQRLGPLDYGAALTLCDAFNLGERQ